MFVHYKTIIKMKSIITFLLVVISTVTFAQKGFQGKAVYYSKTTIDMERFNNGDIPEERKKRILERIKSNSEKTYTLSFNKSSSLYKENEKLEAPTSGGGRGPRFSFSGGTQYKNIPEKEFLEAREVFSKNFLIKDEVTMPQWEMGSETKKIGNYTCYKATMMKEDNSIQFRGPRRGKEKTKEADKKEEKKEPKMIQVTAWYTLEVPVSNGPSGYWGLPGLILEINEGRTTVLCTELVLNPKEAILIEKPKKGTKITREKFNKMLKEKMEEMRERFGGRRGNGAGGRR